MVDVVAGVLDPFAGGVDHFVSAILGHGVGHAFLTGLEEGDGFHGGDEVQVQQGSEGFVVGGREEDLAVNAVSQILASDASVVLEAVHSDVAGVFAVSAHQVGLDGVFTIAVGIVPVVDESANEAGLHHVVFHGAISVQGEILPDQAFIVPLVQDADAFLVVRIQQVTVVIAVHIQGFVRDIFRNLGDVQQVGTPADVGADGEGNHLGSVVAQQQLSVVAEGHEAVIELFLGGRDRQTQLIQPVLADEGVQTGRLGQNRFDGPHSASLRILIVVDVVVAQQLPQVGQQILIFRQQRIQIGDAVHACEGLDGGVGVGDAHVGRVAGGQQVVQVVNLGPAADGDQLNVHVVLFEHLLLDVLRVDAARRIGAAVVVAVVDFHGDVTGLGELAVHKAIVSRRGRDDAHREHHRQSQNQSQDTFHMGYLLLFSGISPSPGHRRKENYHQPLTAPIVTPVTK